MNDIHSEVSKLVNGYALAMARFDGEPCAQCGDAFDHRQSNYFPVWSDDHDNLICVNCYEKEKSGNA